MGNAPRPTAARKHTRATKEKRDKELSEGISIEVDKKVYTVYEADLTGIDIMAMRKEVGLSFVGVMTAMRNDPDIDLIAAIVWLARRIKGERGLAYNEVAGEIAYDTDFDIVEAPEEDPADPEA